MIAGRIAPGTRMTELMHDIAIGVAPMLTDEGGGVASSKWINNHHYLYVTELQSGRYEVRITSITDKEEQGIDDLERQLAVAAIVDRYGFSIENGDAVAVCVKDEIPNKCMDGMRLAFGAEEYSVITEALQLIYGREED